WLPKDIPSCIALEMGAVPAGILHSFSSRLPNQSVVSVDDDLLRLRRHKASDELDLLRRCIAAGEAGHARSWEVVRPGATELEVYGEIVRACTKSAGQPVVLYGDFCSGPRTWQTRGGPPTSRRLEASDLMILDFS